MKNHIKLHLEFLEGKLVHLQKAYRGLFSSNSRQKHQNTPVTNFFQRKKPLFFLEGNLLYMFDFARF